MPDTLHFRYLADPANECYRVRRSDWPSDTFEMLRTDQELEDFRVFCARWGFRLVEEEN
jgi:hypothetical protein